MCEGVQRAWRILAALVMAAGCSGSVETASTGGGDGGGSASNAGACGTALGCNSLEDVGPAIVPTCASGPVPAGQGGAIVDGRYVLTSQTYYGEGTCPTEAVSGTITLSQNCIQLVATAIGSTGPVLSLHGSASLATAGSSLVLTFTCSSSANTSTDTPSQTYTATPTSFTRFVDNTGTSSTNPNRVEVFTLR